MVRFQKLTRNLFLTLHGHNVHRQQQQQLSLMRYQQFAGSIPASVSGFFIDIKSFRSHNGPGVDSASNRNEYQEHFLGVKAAGA